MEKSVVIVDDHLLLAKSLKIMVDSFEGYRVIHTLPNGQELVEYYSNIDTKPDVLLLDIKMPVMNGLDTMAWLQENAPEQKVLALSMEDDEATVLSMIRLGVNGYILKDIDPNEFHLALNTLMKEGYYHSDLFRKVQQKETDLSNLNDMEIQFLKYSCSELTYREIAVEMRRSFKTIDGYRETLFRKLQVKSRTGLALYAVKHNVVTI